MLPNILWIVTTQWRAQACGYAGDPNAHTPALDKLVRAGASFSQAVTPHPFGPFARAALLTGLPSPQNGIADYYDPLPLGTKTIAHHLRERGYATAFLGKWHLGARDRDADLVGESHARIRVPEEARGGFEFWEGFESGFLSNDPWLHGTRLPEPVRFPGYQSDVVCSRAAAVIAGLPKPWFAVVSVEPPHPPYRANAAGLPFPDPDRLVLRGNVPIQSEGRARRELAGYYAHIEATDRAIGRLAEASEADTRLVITSVHGDMHGSQGLFRKGWPYEESVRVPLIIRSPEFAGSSSAPLSLVDLPGIAIGWAEGRPTALPGDFARVSMPSIVALPAQCDRIWRGIRSASRKLILNADGSPWLFFDLERDPLEQHNLASDPSRASEIASFAEAC